MHTLGQLAKKGCRRYQTWVTLNNRTLSAERAVGTKRRFERHVLYQRHHFLAITQMCAYGRSGDLIHRLQQFTNQSLITFTSITSLLTH